MKVLKLPMLNFFDLFLFSEFPHFKHTKNCIVFVIAVVEGAKRSLISVKEILTNTK